MTEEEIIGFSEAYDYYNNLLSEDEKQKIPDSFVEKMKKFSKKEYLGKIKEIYDVSEVNISRDGAKKIAFMELCIG